VFYFHLLFPTIILCALHILFVLYTPSISDVWLHNCARSMSYRIEPDQAIRTLTHHSFSAGRLEMMINVTFRLACPSLYEYRSWINFYSGYLGNIILTGVCTPWALQYRHRKRAKNYFGEQVCGLPRTQQTMLEGNWLRRPV
jgi:hypothetical protein